MLAYDLFILIATGMIKVIKNTTLVALPNWLIFWTTQLHNSGTFLLVLGIVGHLAAFVFKENRYLLPGMFTGHVCCHYTEWRHKLWHENLDGEIQSQPTITLGAVTIPNTTATQ